MARYCRVCGWRLPRARSGDAVGLCDEACEEAWQNQTGGIVRAKEYEVLRRAVEEGVAAGLRRFNKYAPEGQQVDADRVADAVEEAVTGSICEWFDFEDEAEEPTFDDGDLGRQ